MMAPLFPKTLEVFDNGDVTSIVPTSGLWRVRRDDEIEEFNFMSRTMAPDYDVDTFGIQTPAVFRYYPVAKEDAGDFRTNVSTLESLFLALNGWSYDKFRYLTGNKTAQFNGQGWPQMAYILMSNNYLMGDIVGDFLRFQTLTINSDFEGMNHNTHPEFIHLFSIVGFRYGSTYVTNNTPQGYISYPLMSKEGVCYIPKRLVIQV